MAFLVLFASASVFSQATPRDRSREDFTRALAKIKKNMPESEVDLTPKNWT